MTFLLDTTARMSIPLAFALVAATMLGRRSAAARHWLLAAAIGCAAATPLLGAALPAWHLQVLGLSAGNPQGPHAPAVVTTIAFTGQPAVSTDRAPAVRPHPASAATLRLRTIVLALWAGGALLGLSTLVVALRRLARIAAAARPASARPAEMAREIGRALGLSRPITLLQSDRPAMLVTWGATRPRVILPVAASEWSDDRLRIVLRHELSHIKRGDWAAQMLAEILRAIYWFNPLIWLACHRLRDAGERACDDAVLNGGVEPAKYASHLLEVARSFTALRRAPGPALAMARSSQLEGRISAMLDMNLNRRPLTARTRLAIAATVLALTVPVAIAAQNPVFTVHGTVSDQTNRVMPGVTLTLSNASMEAKHEIRSDRGGHFEFVGLPPGEYELKAAEPGFAAHVEKFTIAESDVTRNVQLVVGSVRETVTVGVEPLDPTDQATRAAKSQAAIARAQQLRQQVADKCAPGGAAVDVGGNIMAPMKVKDVRPVYPEQLRGSNVSGAVTLDAVIATDGSVRGAQAVSSPNADFTRAAIDAVRQWEFTPTVLNCTPIEVRMQVTVNFTTERK